MNKVHKLFVIVLICSGAATAQNTLPANGNVGIGTTNPTTELDVNGNVRIRTLEDQALDPSQLRFLFINKDGSIEPGPIVRSEDFPAIIIPDPGGMGGIGGGAQISCTGAPTTASWKDHDTQDKTVVLCPEDNDLQLGNNLYVENHISGSSAYYGHSVSIGTTNVPSGYKLAVDGKIITEEVDIRLSGNWPDYVFEEEYVLVPLAEVEQYINENKHLPEVPSAEEVEKEGISVGEMNAVLLKKIEELTLHMIEQEKRIKELEKKSSE